MGLEKRECQEKRGAECSLLSFTCLKKAIQAQHMQLLNGGKEKNYNSCDLVSLQGSRANSSIRRDLGT